jgi:hypothetical protein
MTQHRPAKVGEYDRPIRIVVRLLLIDRFQNHIRPFEFHSLIDSGALQVDLDLLSVAITLPRGNFVFQHGEAQHAAVEALPPVVRGSQ